MELNYYRRNIEKYKKYYLNNKERLIKYQKNWIKNNYERQLWLGCRSRSRKNNIPFNIEVQDIVIPSICPILEIPLIKQNLNRKSEASPSVDRIIPELGYTKGNIQIISKKANVMKNNATSEELLKFSKWVLKNY